MSDNKEQCRVKPWEDRMQEYFAQGSVAIRTSTAFMAEEIADWRAAQPVVLSDEQINSIAMDAVNKFAELVIAEQFTGPEYKAARHDLRSLAKHFNPAYWDIGSVKK